MRLMKLAKYFFLMSLILFAVVACSRNSSAKKEEIITVESRALSSSLFYSGIIQPYKTHVITSPADGAIIDILFQYGETVKKSDLLFKISSAKFLTDYKTALMAYIKAKSELNNAQSTLNEYKFLHDNKLVSDDEFKNKESSYYAARLALLQSQDTLENLLQQLGSKKINPYDLSISDIDKINQALHLQEISSESLRIYAPVSGVILSPSKSEEENKKIAKGDVIKQGDVLAVIGDMSSLSVRIKVNELTVPQLKPGQKVKVSGLAFPEYTLNGEITRIDRQGETVGGGVPSFRVEILVAKLTPAQQNAIHIGMSAKVRINLESEPQLQVPIRAVFEKNGVSYVHLYNQQSKKIQEVKVQTGKTTADTVIITSGIHAGDQLLVQESAL